MRFLESGRPACDRRAALGVVLGAPAALAVSAAPARAARPPAPPRPMFHRRWLAGAWDRKSLNVLRRETGERFDGVYFEHGAALGSEIDSIDWLLRDVRQGQACRMDRRLIELLRQVQQAAGGRQMVVTSGFRTQATNDRLRRRGAAARSLHLKGQAVDFYMPGLSARRLARLVLETKMGGVGLYERRGFVHADVGRVRYWRG